MRSYSLDLRERVLADCDGGQSNDAVALKYRVSASWIRKLKQRRRETGSIAPRVKRKPQPRWMSYADEIRQAVDDQPDRTLRELREALGLRLSVPSLCRALQHLRLTMKKKGVASGRARSARRGRTATGLASRNGRRAGRTLGLH